MEEKQKKRRSPIQNFAIIFILFPKKGIIIVWGRKFSSPKAENVRIELSIKFTKNQIPRNMVWLARFFKAYILYTINQKVKIKKSVQEFIGQDETDTLVTIHSDLPNLLLVSESILLQL